MQLLFDSNIIVYIFNILLLAITILASIFVVTFKNPVHAALSLMFTFITTAICWITLNAEFLAFTLILLYVGSIMVVFLFVIMMLDLKSSNHNVRYKSNIVKSLIITIIFAIIFIYIAKDYNFPVTISIANNNLQLLSKTLFADYLLLFATAGLLLLASIISVVSLCDKEKVNRKTQSIYQQTTTNKQQRLKMLDTI